jgi:DNA-binding PadR family transcriptional regulator
MIEELTLKQLLTEPQKLDDLHIPQNIVIDIIFRLLFNEGNVALSRFVEVLKISNRIIDDVMLWMQKEHFVEVSKASSELGRLGYVYALTDAGKQRARDAMDRSLYVGPVPVPIHYYTRGIELQTQHRKRVNCEQVKESLRSLVLPTEFHRRIGPAINSGSSLFFAPR